MKKVLMVVVTCILCAVVLGISAPVTVFAGDTEIHGYGKQSFMQSSKNNYLDTKEGSFADTNVDLVFTNKIADNTSVWVQIFGDASSFGLDWAYVDYKFNNGFSVRAGQMKLPIGIFNEIRDIQILHLGILEPIMYRTEGDIVFEAYRGVGANYKEGPVTVDLYGGSFILNLTDPAEKCVTKELIGGKLSYETPIEGLNLIGSYATFQGKIIDAATGTVITPEGKEHTMVVSVKYDNHNVELNAEYAKNKKLEGPSADSYYVEAGYRFFDKLTPFVRYDFIADVSSGVDRSDPSNYQKETVVGVGYKINSNFAVKAEERFIDGYYLVLNNGDINSSLEKKWSMFTTGINFMF